MASDGATESAPGRRWAVGTIGAGLLLSGAVMLAATFSFKIERPVAWPPASTALYSAAYGILGTFAIFALYSSVYLVVGLASTVAGRRSWREVIRRTISVAVAVTVMGTSVAVSLRIFYWPWARASAVKTILSGPAKWRLTASARTFADHWDAQADLDLKDAVSGSSPASVKAGAAYALARAGNKEYLERLVKLAGSLPSANSAGEASTQDAGVKTREDVLWLVSTLVEKEAAAGGPSGPGFDEIVPRLEWDARAKRYRLSTGENESAVTLY